MRPTAARWRAPGNRLQAGDPGPGEREAAGPGPQLSRRRETVCGVWWRRRELDQSQRPLGVPESGGDQGPLSAHSSSGGRSAMVGRTRRTSSSSVPKCSPTESSLLDLRVEADRARVAACRGGVGIGCRGTARSKTNFYASSSQSGPRSVRCPPSPVPFWADPTRWACSAKCRLELVLWMGFRSVRCPVRAWGRALRREGPWTSGGVGSGTVLRRGRERVVQAFDAALRGDTQGTVSGIARAASAARRGLKLFSQLLVLQGGPSDVAGGECRHQAHRSGPEGRRWPAA